MEGTEIDKRRDAEHAERRLQLVRDELCDVVACFASAERAAEIGGALSFSQRCADCASKRVTLLPPAEEVAEHS